MATGTTILEGWVERLGRWIHWVFFIYLILWSYCVGGALINACGVAGVGLFPIGDPQTSKIFWGIVHSLVGLALVWFGGFRIFKYAMSLLTAIMFATVLLTVFLIRPDWPAIGRILFHPALPAGGTAWLLGVLGGIGGTVTLLSYSYWVREKNRSGRQGVKACRLDLGLGYALTGFFGASMVIIGSRVTIEGQGANVALVLADQLARALGPAGKSIFLWGFWGAVFSSLLGVWQSVPYLFADFLHLRRGLVLDATPEHDIAKTREYRGYLLGLSVLPIHLLWFRVQEVQLVYAVTGALFMPLLALTLLLMNNRRSWVGPEFRTRWMANALLILTLAFFATIGVQEILGAFTRP